MKSAWPKSPMIDFTIETAGRVVAVSALFESTREYCKDYLCDGTADFSVEVTPEDIRFEREKAMREDAVEGLPLRDYTDAQLEITALLRKITEELFAFDTLLFHGSVVAVDGVGYLFTAKSGTGKSTHTRFWRQLLGERAMMVNDDKPFLRVTPEGVLAYGSPWDGKHRLSTNICVPLKAICILQRGGENRIREIPAKDAVFMLLQQSNRPAQGQNMPRYLELMDRLAQSVKLHRLECTISPEAAKLAFETMSGE